MSFILKIYLILLFVSIAEASIKLKTSNSFETIYKEILLGADLISGQEPSEVLVIFDIDDTILITTNCIPGVWLKRVKECPTTLTDPNLAKYLLDLQSNNFGTMALTARGRMFKKYTFRELNRHGISFAGFPFGSDFNFTLPLGKKGVVDLEDGVIHAGSKNKADVLSLFQEQLETPYRTVIFVDDNIKNIQDFDARFKEDLNIHVIAYHYSLD